MRRFFAAAAAHRDGADWHVTLDDRPVRSPARAALVVPSRSLAEAIVDEWNAQGARIAPHTMPMTGLANAAIDHVRPAREAFVDALAAYGETDLVCYRADTPADLAARQCAAWDPLVAWAARRYDLMLRTTTGIGHLPQDAAALARLRAALEALGDFTLGAMQPLVTISGSLVIALALVEGEIDADTAWTAGHLDELYQVEKWGDDAGAAAARKARRDAFEAAARFVTLSRASP